MSADPHEAIHDAVSDMLDDLSVEGFERVTAMLLAGGFAGDISNSLKKLEGFVAAGQYKKAIAYFQSKTPAFSLSPLAFLAASFSFTKTGNEDGAQFCGQVALRLCEIVARSGEGTRDEPYELFAAPDGAAFLQLKMRTRGQLAREVEGDGRTLYCYRTERSQRVYFGAIDEKQAQAGAQQATARPGQVIRHAEREPQLTVDETADEELMKAVTEHVSRHVGEVKSVFHEAIPIGGAVHVDLLIVEPGPGHEYRFLCTCGMSARPTTVPEGYEEWKYAELCLALPPEWPIAGEAQTDPRYSWPLTWLRKLAHYVHMYETWFMPGHTIPNGDPPESFSRKTPLCCWFLARPRLLDASFGQVEVDANRTVKFLATVPIHQEEMFLKLSSGAEKLEELLDAEGVTELVREKRLSVF